MCAFPCLLLPSLRMERTPALHGQVETSRPFRSVKEAVSVYGERVPRGSTAKLDNSEMPTYAPAAQGPARSAASSPHSCSSSQFVQGDLIILDALRKLEEEMEETKREIMLLKERESRIDKAVAAIRAQLQKSTPVLAEIEQVKGDESNLHQKASGEQIDKVRSIVDFEASFKYLPTLAQSLSIASNMDEDEFSTRRRRMKMAKRKPIIPLIRDIFSYKKKESTADHLSRSTCSRSSFISVLS